ncbi:hypothetical protein OY671_009571, partial [Metschnikowia pulcherrima]
RQIMTVQILQFGCGNMGGAMLAGWSAAGFDPAAFTIVDPRSEAAPAGVRSVRSIAEATGAYDVVSSGFKPQQFADAMATVRPFVTQGTSLLSILAGVDLATSRGAFPDAGAVVRV